MIFFQAGARLVLWSEITTVVNNEEDEAEFLDKVKDLAISSQVYIAVAYRRLEPSANKLVFVLKNGTIGIDYKKAHPAPGVSRKIKYCLMKYSYLCIC